MKSAKHPLIKGTLLLTGAGLISRIIGFYYKIFLAGLIGAEGIGVYQMVFPVYVLCLSLSSSGIQTAISRFTAEKRSRSCPRDAHRLFLTGLFLALVISLLLSLVLYLGSGTLSVAFFRDPRCRSVLRLLALALPFETLHVCANGYFLGRKSAGFPALSQLLEQCVRVFSTILFSRFLVSKQLTPSPKLAAAGLLTAELAAAVFTAAVLILQSFSDRYKRAGSFVQNVSSLCRSFFSDLAVIYRMALPVTADRLMLNLLQSAEAAIIPLRLSVYYKNTSAALASYGVFSGMALPLILFPCVLPASFSMLLLPTVSEANALKNKKKITEAIHSSLLLCFFLGISCTAAFLLFGPPLSLLLFKNTQAGSILAALAWLCPFLYLNTISSSILHGLGKTRQVFFHNLIGLLIRLMCSWFLLPFLGIAGCLLGLLFSQITTVVLSVSVLKRNAAFPLKPDLLILFPITCVLAATGFLKILQFLFPVLQNTGKWGPLLLSGGIWLCTVLLLFEIHRKKTGLRKARSFL